jgi:hypothetical protein
MSAHPQSPTYIFRFIADTLFRPRITPTGPYSLRTSFATTQTKTKTSINLDPNRDQEEGLDLTMGVGLMGHRLLPNIPSADNEVRNHDDYHRYDDRQRHRADGVTMTEGASIPGSSYFSSYKRFIL